MLKSFWHTTEGMVEDQRHQQKHGKSSDQWDAAAPLVQRNFTASEADIRMLEMRRGPQPMPVMHQPVSIHQAHAISPPMKLLKRRTLDGFHLLEFSGATLPHDARQAVFIDKGLTDVVEEDFPHFENLILLDVSENALQFHMFSGFPRLKALNMACNCIQTIEREPGTFHYLQILDLSYNSLTQRSVQNLDFLPNLKELDLSGNNLCVLPMEMYRFLSLEKLFLDNNKIDDNQVFSVLCLMQKLRHCSLAYNFLHKVPSECCGEGYFALLTQLDISFNYFGSEEDVHALVDLPRLQQVMLYGNPLLGPTGEDPLYTYIEDLEAAATDGRHERRLCKIDIITEIPRKRNFAKLKGRSAGRHATYREFSIVKVDETGGNGKPMKTGKEWKEEGNRTLFAEAIAQAQKEKLMASLPDNTFITMQGNLEEDKKILKLADKVMDQVAKDMDLTTSAEILYFQDRTRLQTTNFDHLTEAALAKMHAAQNESMRKMRAAIEGEEEEEEEWKFDYELEGQEGADDDGRPAVDQLPRDQVPHGMFTRTMADPKTLQTHPVAVRTAMRALQFAIRHPLTNYDEVPARGGMPPKDYVRETKASINRKMPRKESNIKILSEFGQIKNKAKRGLGEPAVVAQTRRKAQQETLVQIEKVLDKLNDSADEISLRGSGNVHSADGIATMKNFARPQTGLRGLVKMVDEVVADLDK